MRYEAVLFDMDGVLIDSMPYHIMAFNECLSKFGLSVSSDQIAGRSTLEILLDIFQKDLNEEEIKSLAILKSTRSLEIMHAFKDKLLMDGAVEILEKIGQSRPIALCTSASSKSVEFVLKELLRKELFNTVIHSGLVKYAKPHPEVYEKAIAFLNVHASRCLVVEDSVSGLESGLAAGCDVAFLSLGPQESEIDSAHVTVIESLWALSKVLSLDEIE